MPAPTLFDTAVDNRSLFSDYYLEERLPQHEEWELDAETSFETDGLIDQIVYRLYGLSQDEIALVEGGA